MTPPRSLPETPDHDLVALARQGREDAYGELLRRHHRAVYALVHRMVRDHDLAEDLTQEAFVKAFEALKTRPPERKFSTWILKIANNGALDHFKRERRLARRGLGTVTLDPTPDASRPSRLRRGALRAALSSTSAPPPPDPRVLAPALEQALGKLKEQYRLCFVLREMEGRSYEDIAEILDLPVGSVGPYLSRARKQLRAELGDLYETVRAPRHRAT